MKTGRFLLRKHREISLPKHEWKVYSRLDEIPSGKVVGELSKEELTEYNLIKLSMGVR